MEYWGFVATAGWALLAEQVWVMLKVKKHSDFLWVLQSLKAIYTGYPQETPAI